MSVPRLPRWGNRFKRPRYLFYPYIYLYFYRYFSAHSLLSSAPGRSPFALRLGRIGRCESEPAHLYLFY